MNNENPSTGLQASGQQVNAQVSSLVKIIGTEVLPALKAYYPSSDFNWKGSLSTFANEYAKQIHGTGVTSANVRAALELARTRSAVERYAPNPIEFKFLCLHASGMPTFDQCMAEINHQRDVSYGKEKQWSGPLVYWLNQKTASSRATMLASSWQKKCQECYAVLADKYAKKELDPIPLKIEMKAEPAYLRYKS